MTTTIKPATLVEALVQFQSLVKNIDLNAEVKVQTKAGGCYAFKYATLGNIMDKIRPLLAQCGIAFSQKIEGGFLETVLFHGTESLVSKLPFLEGFKTAQELGSVITYSRRYGLVMALGLVADDDDDGNVSVGNTAVKKEVVRNDRRTPTQEEFEKLLKSTNVKVTGGTTKTGRKWYATDGFWLTSEQADLIHQEQLRAIPAGHYDPLPTFKHE